MILEFNAPLLFCLSYKLFWHDGDCFGLALMEMKIRLITRINLKIELKKFKISYGSYKS